MKYVSYSLWGDNPIYGVGAIKNMHQVKEIYPDWQMKPLMADQKLSMELVCQTSMAPSMQSSGHSIAVNTLQGLKEV